MIISNLFKPKNQAAPGQTMTLPELVDVLNPRASSGQVVTVERSMMLSAAYRCINILTDDIAKMPLQTFISRADGQIERVKPSSVFQNIAWLLEVRPNRWMTPFVFKKTVSRWAITQGAGYIWLPPRQAGAQREMFILAGNRTWPLYDLDGNLWYKHIFSNGKIEYLPDVEVMPLLINSEDGVTGNSVITKYAKETLGRQLGAHETQAKFYAQGLNPGGVVWLDGTSNPEARQKIRDAYQEAMGGSANAYSLAVFDNKITKFEQITMKPVDAQFLESIQATDVEIANFFGVPLYRLNSGKQSYESNDQQKIDYLDGTLDPYLVQWEQAALLKWLSEEEQNFTYFRFNRDVILRTDAKTRANYLKEKIMSGQMSPNEARKIEDQPAYKGGDVRFIPANMAVIQPDGTIEVLSKDAGQQEAR